MVALCLLVRHCGAAFFYTVSVLVERARATCTEVTQNGFLNQYPPKDQPILAYRYSALEWPSGTLSPVSDLSVTQITYSATEL